MNTKWNAYALAEALGDADDHDGITLGPTDAALAAKALRSYGRQKARRAKARIAGGLGLLGLILTPAVASSDILDVNHDGVICKKDFQLILARLFLTGRHAVADDGGPNIHRIVEFADGKTYSVKLAFTTDQKTDFKVVEMHAVQDIDAEFRRIEKHMRPDPSIEFLTK